MSEQDRMFRQEAVEKLGGHANEATCAQIRDLVQSDLYPDGIECRSPSSLESKLIEGLRQKAYVYIDEIDEEATERHQRMSAYIITGWVEDVYLDGKFLGSRRLGGIPIEREPGASNRVDRIFLNPISVNKWGKKPYLLRPGKVYQSEIIPICGRMKRG